MRPLLNIMAQMIPATGPLDSTGSKIAEPDIYWRLKKQLPDSFIVIHSIPWLSSVAREIDSRPVPTGEIDFLILHPDLGLLALEIKGGVFGFDRSRFVYLYTGEKIDPVRQVRRGTHSLERWLKESGVPMIRIGYALVFPHSELGSGLPPALIDTTVSPHQALTIDKRDLPELDEKIVGLMRYWQRTLSTEPLGEQRIGELIDLICPLKDYSPTWPARIEYDDKTWLKLTEEQFKIQGALIKQTRSVVTGWPGTGKTLLAISLARHLAQNKQSVLFLVFNVPLVKHLEKQFDDQPKIRVMNFHGLCREAAKKDRKPIPKDAEKLKEWYKGEAYQVFHKAVEQGLLPNYDALIIDEAQVFHADWLTTLASWMGDKRITAFCDETQVFEFEERTIVEELRSIIGSGEALTLTINMRSPRSVFEHLLEVVPSTYQQHNPRPQEPDTLLELAVESPALTLEEILCTLRAEGIPKEAITILHHHQSPPEFEELKGYEVQVERIARFRGLESPIVIIYAPGKIDDTSLFCAYSRATTRCIAIYDAYEVKRQACGTFGRMLLDSEQGPAICEAANSGYTASIIKRLDLSIQSVVSKTGSIQWCREWGAWIAPTCDTLSVADTLWLDQLSLTASRPIYHFDKEMRGGIGRIKKTESLMEDTDFESGVLASCEICGEITPHTILLGEPHTCSVCDPLTGAFKGSSLPQEAKSLAEWDEALYTPKQISKHIKQQMPISLFALGYWRTLSEPEQAPLTHKIVTAGGKIGYRAALVLTGVDIIKASPGDEFVLKTLAERYYRWNLWLTKHASFEKWRGMVANAFAEWKQRKIVVKRDKGIYYRA